MANLFDVFTVSFGKAKDARIAELETDLTLRTTQRDAAELIRLIEGVARIGELEASVGTPYSGRRDEEIARNAGLGEQHCRVGN